VKAVLQFNALANDSFVEIRDLLLYATDTSAIQAWPSRLAESAGLLTQRDMVQ
jgi:hypothetical protein